MPARRRITSLKSQLRANREELQRVQVGLVGLAGVLMIVTLANLITTARSDATADATAAAINQGIAGVANATASQAGTNEPLADLGVTPTADSASPVAPSVPDLEPDPRLRQRMDQDPKRQSSSQ